MAARDWDILKSIEREVVSRIVVMVAIMLGYWLLVLQVLSWFDSAEPWWLVLLVFFLPVIPVFLLFYRRFENHPFKLGLRLYEKGGYDEAATEFHDAMHKLHVGAAVMLGAMYLEGKGVRRDPARGVMAIRKALANYYFLRNLLPEYLKKGGLSRRMARAALHDQSADQGRDWLLKAIPPLEKAAAEGVVPAMALLRDIYGMQDPVLGNLDKSIEYGRRAAEMDGEDAEISLAMRLVNAPDASADRVAEGLRILERHFRQGSLYTGWFLALQYADGENPHLRKDLAKAAGYFEDLLVMAETAREDPEKIRLYIETLTDLFSSQDKGAALNPHVRKMANNLLARTQTL